MGWKIRFGEQRKIVSDVHASELVNVLYLVGWFVFDINLLVFLDI
jgi:hypothetical protein